MLSTNANMPRGEIFISEVTFHGASSGQKLLPTFHTSVILSDVCHRSLVQFNTEDLALVLPSAVATTIGNIITMSCGA
jgi:hypothetical protein